MPAVTHGHTFPPPPPSAHTHQQDHAHAPMHGRALTHSLAHSLTSRRQTQHPRNTDAQSQRTLAHTPHVGSQVRSGVEHVHFAQMAAANAADARSPDGAVLPGPLSMALARSTPRTNPPMPAGMPQEGPTGGRKWPGVSTPSTPPLTNLRHLPRTPRESSTEVSLHSGGTAVRRLRPRPDVAPASSPAAVSEMSAASQQFRWRSCSGRWSFIGKARRRSSCASTPPPESLRRQTSMAWYVPLGPPFMGGGRCPQVICAGAFRGEEELTGGVC